MKFGMCVCSVFLAGVLPAAEVVITTNAARTNTPPVIAAPRTNAFKGIQVKPGFRLELVAAEPLVVNPGAMAFDENGRLFVVETPDGQPGRVRLLEDTDGDGIFDSSRVYAENVYGATALACYGGGVFVGAGSELLYLKDSRGDGQADVRRVVFNSFGEATNGANGVVVFTAMVWGLDNRIHVATAGRGGDIISSSLPKQSLVLSAGCFSFDPRTFVLADESGSGPSGMSFDNRGRKFVANPTNHLQRVMYESRYAARNAFVDMPDALADMDERNVIYPIAAAQPLAVQFFAAAGLSFYRGYLFPSDYVDNPFVADPSAGVVHHDRLRTNGLDLTAERAADETRSEFLTVSDNSFRPVAFANGPEGALYLAGSAREPAVLAAGQNAKTNSPAAQGFGRIYRVVPVNFKQPPLTQFSRAAVTNLVNGLRHSDGWHRDSAARLLYERQDKASIVPLIQLLYDPRSPPLGRMYALHALAGLQTLVPGHLVRALNDQDDRVREHAVLLSEKLLTNGMMLPDAVWGEMIKMSGDSSPQVRYQLAFTLGQFRNAGRVQALADTLRSDPGSRWMQAAALSSLNEGAAEMLGLLATDGNFRNGAAGRDFLGRLAAMIGAKNQPEEVAQAMSAIAAIPEPEVAFRVARRLGDGLQSAKSSLAAADLQGILRPVYASATRAAVDMNASEAARAEGLRLLDAANVWDPQIGLILVQQWFYLTARLRTEMVTALNSRPDSTVTLMVALLNLAIPPADLSFFEVRFLLTQPNQELRRQASLIYGDRAIPSRQGAVDQFAAAAQMAGVRERGRALFVARCGDCHQAGNDGNFSGTVLKEYGGTAKEKVLVKIVDPNRDVSTNNSAVLLITGDGATLAGNVTVQNARSLTLCQLNGELRVLGRQNVQSQTSLGMSAMPSGLEAGLSQQDMADLLEFLCPGSLPQ